MPRTVDWRSPDAAEALKNLDRPGLAWEFLRRNPEYREHYRRTLERIGSGVTTKEAAQAEISRRWGVSCVLDPDAPANLHPTIWRPDLLPPTVVLVPAPDCYPDARELPGGDFGSKPASAIDAGCDQLVVEDPSGDHHLWLRGVEKGQKLAAVLALDDDLRVRVLSLIRFYQHLTKGCSGPLPKACQITRRHRQRLIRMIRALDGRLAHASYREIATALFGAEAVKRYAWKTSSVRGQTIRLVKDGVGMMRGGYRKLLRGE